MFYKENICKNIISVCLGKASLALALGFLIFNPASSAHAATCASTSVSWSQNGNTCSGTTGTGESGNYGDDYTVVEATGTNHGGAMYKCNGSGSWVLTNSGGSPNISITPTCAPPGTYKVSPSTWRSEDPLSNPCSTNLVPSDSSGACSSTLFPANACNSGTVNNTCSTTHCPFGAGTTQQQIFLFWKCSAGAGGGATAVNGVCSSTANECTYGTYMDETDTATNVQWRCNGQNGGTNSGVCTAPRAISGVCGYASGRTYTSAPAASDSLCTTGSPSSVSGDGTSSSPWRWSCAGQNGGSNAACAANLCLPPVDGLCNNASNNSCARGSSANSRDTATEFLWECVGENGGATDQCSRAKPSPPVNGSCNNTVENGCRAGTLNNTADSATHFLWQCLGINSGTSESCNMERPAAVNGACNNSSLNGCSAGTWRDQADNTNYYYWACNGSNGGSNDSCVMARPRSDGVCDLSNRNSCSIGSVLFPSEDSTRYYWYCEGVNGGDDKYCAIAKTSTPPNLNGYCNNSSVNSCSAGELVDIGDTNSDYLWVCKGSGTGTNDNCSSPKPVSTSGYWNICAISAQTTTGGGGTGNTHTMFLNGSTDCIDETNGWSAGFVKLSKVMTRNNGNSVDWPLSYDTTLYRDNSTQVPGNMYKQTSADWIDKWYPTQNRDCNTIGDKTAYSGFTTSGPLRGPTPINVYYKCESTRRDFVGSTCTLLNYPYSYASRPAPAIDQSSFDRDYYRVSCTNN